jgi:glycosyltransferase involved in cell wall biosynthesis
MNILNPNLNDSSATKLSGISIISAVRNEEDGILNFIREIHDVKQNYNDLQIQLILVEDGSTDKTIEKILDAPLNNFLKLIQIQKGQGQGWAIGIGYLAIGNSSHIIMMDADGSHDIQSIHQIVKDFRRGYDLAQGQKEISYKLQFRDQASSIFGRVSGMLFKIPFVEQNTIYRGVSRELINLIEKRRPSFWEFLRFSQHEWNKINPSIFTFQSNKRRFGTSKFNFSRLLKFAINGIFTTGNFFLASLLYFGLVALTLSFSFLITQSLVAFYCVLMAIILKKRKSDLRKRMSWRIIYKGAATF